MRTTAGFRSLRRTCDGCTAAAEGVLRGGGLQGPVDGCGAGCGFEWRKGIRPTSMAGIAECADAVCAGHNVSTRD
jgi:hypothetical protein